MIGFTGQFGLFILQGVENINVIKGEGIEMIGLIERCWGEGLIENNIYNMNYMLVLCYSCLLS